MKPTSLLSTKRLPFTCASSLLWIVRPSDHMFCVAWSPLPKKSASSTTSPSPSCSKPEPHTARAETKPRSAHVAQFEPMLMPSPFWPAAQFVAAVLARRAARLPSTTTWSSVTFDVAVPSDPRRTNPRVDDADGSVDASARKTAHGALDQSRQLGPLAPDVVSVIGFAITSTPETR